MNRARGLWLAFVVTIGAALVLAGCSAASSAPGTSPSASASPATTTGIRGTATAGPVCPVERVPPESACAPRPVAGAVIVVSDADGKKVAEAHTDADGTFLVTVPAGTYTVAAEGAAGAMHAPGPQSVTVTDDVAVVDLTYDTGIR